VPGLNYSKNSKTDKNKISNYYFLIYVIFHLAYPPVQASYPWPHPALLKIFLMPAEKRKVPGGVIPIVLLAPEALLDCLMSSRLIADLLLDS
jgi:hypothetical protein